MTVEDLSFILLFVVFFVLSFSTLVYNPKYRLIPIVTVAETTDPNKNEIRCLADNIYHEARDQPLDGMIAVANVVINRTRSNQYPAGICQTIYQRGQFSWVRSGEKITDVVSYRKSYDVAENVYYGGYSDITSGSTYYHSRAINPSWVYKLSKTVTISDHIFYKDRS
jgi:N-acetylmuramoyl-L-alanine amidase